MNDTKPVYVTLEPRSPKARLFSTADLQAALERVREQIPPSASRYAIWTESPTPEQEDHDVVVCVPVAAFEDRRSQAEEVLRRWDGTWLLVASMPHRHRGAARQHLVDEISMALLASAVVGVGEPAEEDDADVGF